MPHLNRSSSSCCRSWSPAAAPRRSARSRPCMAGCISENAWVMGGYSSAEQDLCMSFSCGFLSVYCHQARDKAHGMQLTCTFASTHCYIVWSVVPGTVRSSSGGPDRVRASIKHLLLVPPLRQPASCATESRRLPVFGRCSYPQSGHNGCPQLRLEFCWIALETSSVCLPP